MIGSILDFYFGVLVGVWVVELVILFVGLFVGVMFGDFGVDVVKVEYLSKFDLLCGYGLGKDGIGLWWKVIGCNKCIMILNLFI